MSVHRNPATDKLGCPSYYLYRCRMSKRAPHKKSIEIESTNRCCYGCGEIAKFLSPGGKEMCSSSASKCPVIRKKNSESLKSAYKNGRRNYANLPKESKERMRWNKGKILANPIFEYDGIGNHKRFLINERGHKCEICGIFAWLGRKIVLELDHIDGDNRNNIRTNLRLLCPNCHSQTDTWRGRNINSGVVKVSDEQLMSALSDSPSIRQALLRVGLAAKGANYSRCYKLISRL